MAILLALLVLLLGGPALAAPPLVVAEPAADRYGLSGHLDFFEDQTGALSPSDVMSAEHAANFQPSIVFPQTPRNPYHLWIRFNLINKSTKDIELILTQPDSSFTNYDYELHIKGDDGSYQEARYPDQLPIFKRQLRDPRVAHTLRLRKDAVQTVYVRISQARLRPKIATDKAQWLVLQSIASYSESSSQNWFWHGWLLGILLIMLIYNIALYFIEKDRSIIYFIITLLGYIFWESGRSGICSLYFHFMNSVATTNQLIVNLGILLFLPGFGGFSIRHLNLEPHSPRLVKGLRVLIGGFFLVSALGTVSLIVQGVAVYHRHWVGPTNNCASANVALLLVLGAIRAFSGHRAAILWLSANERFSFTSLVFVLTVSDRLPKMALTLNATQIGMAAQIALLAIGLSDRMRRLRIERERSERVLHNVLPPTIAERLKSGELTIAERHPEVTVLFADIAGFTPLSSGLSPDELVAYLNRVFSRLDELAQQHGLEKIKTIGDCYMLVGGLPTPRADHAAAVADMALAMLSVLDEIEPPAATARVHMRIGLHSGPVVAGVIGRQKFAYDLWGDTVNTASRMESHGEAGRVHCSEAVHKSLRTQFAFCDRGEIEVKGKGRMHTYFLEGRTKTA